MTVWSPMNRVDHDVVDHRRITADLNNALSMRDSMSSRVGLARERERETEGGRWGVGETRTGKDENTRGTRGGRRLCVPT